MSEARSAMETVSSDVVVLDQGLSNGDGMLLLEGWRRAGIDTPVLILTARDTVSDRIEGLQVQLPSGCPLAHEGVDNPALRLARTCARLDSVDAGYGTVFRFTRTTRAFLSPSGQAPTTERPH
ncbi:MULTISPECIES: response regulator [Halomonas]|uniref:Response regulator receiver domain-containing protein n=1 Tax=Halomonas ventosae TaxID=229007 RepID=A0A4R6HGZ4_9GAMM|nr:response regulator [Halomonas ventosae]TDO07644.1 response regulator receiver domain-containing protein [Halomonas ventosae]